MKASQEVINNSLEYLHKQRISGCKRRNNSSAGNPLPEPGTHRYCQSAQVLHDVNAEIQGLLAEITQRKQQQLERDLALLQFCENETEAVRAEEDFECNAETGSRDSTEPRSFAWHSFCCVQLLKRCFIP